jgi:hypothetical protein
MLLRDEGISAVFCLFVKKRKISRVTGGLAVVTALLALVALPTAGAAIEPPLPTPATVLTLSPVQGYIQDTLQGSVCRSPNTCVPVDYFPFYTSGGVTALGTAIDTSIGAMAEHHKGEVVVFGYSHGAQVATQWLVEHANDPDAPSSEQLLFVLMGNANRAYGGANVPAGKVMPQTQYHVIDISRQYDYVSDVPNGPFNLVAAANALAGFALGLHDYTDVDINDPANTVWTEGNTTYVFVPTENLPLLEPLRWVGLHPLADELNGPMKEIVEQGYDRRYLTTAHPAPPASTPTAAPALSSSVASEPRMASRDVILPVNLGPARAAAISAAKFTGQEQANNTGEGHAVDTVTTTPSPDRADVLSTVQSTTSPSDAKPGLDDSVATEHSTTPWRTHTTATSTTDGNKVKPDKVGENQATTRGGDQAPPTKESEQSADTTDE